MYTYGIMSMEASMVASPQFFSYIGIEPKSDFELARMTEEGLPLDSIVSLKDHGLTFTEISDIIISPRTLKHRKSRREPLSNEETDRVVRVARLLSMAEEIFGSRTKALAWLRAKDDRLDNRAPLQMLSTESGGRLIENMLWQIDEGAFS
jgi:putative toxin-antitoxin system antitoxin component (TIGR02293 family)